MKRLLTKLTILLFLFNLSSIPFSGSVFFDQETVTGNSITTGCWSPPSVPVLLSPTNDTIAGTNHPWMQNPLMDWEDSKIYCDELSTLRYQYESFYDSALTQLAYQSVWLTASEIPAPGTPDGVYYWRVRAKDGQENISEFSDTWKLTVDRVSPSTPTLQITGSYTKAIEEKITNGDFSSGDLLGWTTVGNVSIGSSSGDYFAIIGNQTEPGNYLWDNRLMQSFASGAKSLSLAYNFFSRDFGSFDNPGFAIKLNGQEIYSLSNFDVNPSGIPDGTVRYTDWQEFKYDLSQVDTSKTNLAIYAGNTGDKDYQSWAYVDKITTYFVSAPLHATYHFDSPDLVKYRIDGAIWLNLNPGNTFTLSAGDHTIEYYALDSANNASPVSSVKIIVDATSPSAVGNLAATDPTVNTVTLTWTAPGNDGSSGRASSYDLRYSTSPIDSSNFNSATRLGQVPSPQASGQSETITVPGLNPSTTYYFALKSADEAPNWSDISNIVSAATSDGETINPGDIVINEIMWISGTSPEQFVELRNTTNRNLDLASLELKLGGVTIHHFSGQTLLANQYLLLSTKNNTNSNLLSTIIDISNLVFDLSRTNLDLSLEWGSSIIDLAWNTFDPVTEGVVDTTAGAEKYYSMERTNIPGDGQNPLNWYTCIDSASSAEFFDPVPNIDFRATPRAINRSENEPLTSLNSPRLTLSASYSAATHQIILKLNNLTVGNSLPYEIIYTNSVGDQGFAGTISDNLSHEFYLGTCSTNGVCLPDSGIGSTASLTVGDFYQSLNLQ